MVNAPELKRIVVPLDGSPLAETTLPWVAMLAGRAGAAVVLTTCVPGGTAPAETSLDHEERSSREKVGAVLKGLGIRVERSVIAGDPGTAIAEFAASAQLIVVATHGRSGIARAILGSVTDKLLRLTTVPVVVVRPEDVAEANRPPVVDTILAPLDGSGIGRDALPWVTVLARLLNANVVLLHAVGVTGQPEGLLNEQALQAVSGYMEMARDDVRAAGLRVEVRYSGSDPKQAINSASSAGTLIVMASAGATGVAGSRRGSVADHVIRNGSTPVVVVPPLGYVGMAIA